MEQKFIAGALPSPEDERDYPITNLLACAGGLPLEYKTDIPSDTFDQGESSECVACSLSLVRYIQEYNQSNNREKFSPSYIYGNRTTGASEGEGMVPREALKSLQDNGVCHYDDYPGFYSYPDAKKYFAEKAEALNELAKPFRISSYYRVKTRTQMKFAIKELHAITAMFPVYDCLYETAEDGIVHYSVIGKNVNYGYHEMTIIGWTRDAWIVKNSWGETWGEKGICYIPFNYPIVEAWACIDEITEAHYTNE